jgi:hypothetical protein
MRHAPLGWMLAVLALAPAARAQEAEAPQVPVFRAGGALGVGIWQALADLDPASPAEISMGRSTF